MNFFYLILTIKVTTTTTTKNIELPINLVLRVSKRVNILLDMRIAYGG